MVSQLAYSQSSHKLQIENLHLVGVVPSEAVLGSTIKYGRRLGTYYKMQERIKVGVVGQWSLGILPSGNLTNDVNHFIFGLSSKFILNPRKRLQFYSTLDFSYNIYQLSLNENYNSIIRASIAEQHTGITSGLSVGIEWRLMKAISLNFAVYNSDITNKFANKNIHVTSDTTDDFYFDPIEINNRYINEDYNVQGDFPLYLTGGFSFYFLKSSKRK